VCGEERDEDIPIAGVGSICPDCLMAGRFLGASGAQRLAMVIDRLSDMSAAVRELLAKTVEEAEILAQRLEYDASRQCFIELAGRFMDDGRPLLAAHVLSRALRLPGQSDQVYEQLGRAALAMDCTREAIQHFKTAGWVAMKSSNLVVLERTLDRLAELAPDDAWLARTREELENRKSAPEPRCRFCERTAQEAGPLVVGSEAAVCAGCVKKLMSLDKETH
jgi:hypothetical protein